MSASARLTLILSLPLGLLGGCETPPEARTRTVALEIPNDWSGADGIEATVPVDWWTAFGGATLAALVAEALANNPDLKSLAARLDRARAQVDLVGAERLPTLDLDATASRTKRNFIGFPGGAGGGDEVFATRTSLYGLSLATTWELDVWGRVAALQQAAIQDQQAVAADLAGARLSLAGNVARAWIDLVETTLQVDLAARNVESWQRTERLVRRRYEQGLRPALDLRLTASNRAGAEALLAQRERLREDAARRVDVLLGRYPSGELATTSGLPVLDPVVPPGLPVQLLARRADLAAAERRLESAELRVAASRAAFYPRLALTASVGTSAPHVGDVLDGDFGVWSILGQAVQPIFEGGRLRAEVEIAEADADAEIAFFTATLLAAFAEVEGALDADARLAAEEASLAVASEEANGARSLASERYASGLTDVVTLLEAERTANAADRSLLTARRARVAARIDLYMALGGGFDERDVAAVIAVTDAADEEPQS